MLQNSGKATIVVQKSLLGTTSRCNLIHKVSNYSQSLSSEPRHISIRYVNTSKPSVNSSQRTGQIHERHGYNRGANYSDQISTVIYFLELPETIVVSICRRTNTRRRQE